MPLDKALTETQLVLLRAAEEVRKGWCQDALERDGEVCARGGMIKAVEAPLYWLDIDEKTVIAPPIVLKADKHFERYLRRHADANLGSSWTGDYVSRWNNAPGRTADEVAAALEAAAFMDVE